MSVLLWREYGWDFGWFWTTNDLASRFTLQYIELLAILSSILKSCILLFTLPTFLMQNVYVNFSCCNHSSWPGMHIYWLINNKYVHKSYGLQLLLEISYEELCFCKVILQWPDEWLTSAQGTVHADNISTQTEWFRQLQVDIWWSKMGKVTPSEQCNQRGISVYNN